MKFSSSKEEKQEFLRKAQELKPLLRSTNYDSSIEKKNITASSLSDSSDLKLTKPNVMSRHDSFDQKLEVKTVGGKRRKKTHSSVIAGNVGSGIGSPRNWTEPLEDNRWDNSVMKNSTSFSANNDHQRSRKNLSNSSHSISRGGDIKIPIERGFDKRFINDPKVAYRLASNEKL